MYYSGKDFPIEHMQSLGVKLRLERQRQKIGIEKIAEATCISQRYLEAIEADDQSSLPGEFFYRAFVRQYSKYLGWDPDEVEKQISMVSSLSAHPTETPIAAANNLTLHSGQQTAALRETLKDQPVRPAQDDDSSKAWFVFAGVVIVACIAYFAWPSFTSAPAPVQKAENTSTVSPPVQTIPEPVKTTPEPPREQLTPPPETKPENPKPAEASLDTPALATATEGKFVLTIRAKETTWIRLTADGAKIYGGTLDAGQERSISAASAELIVGNAGTLDVLYNGKPLSYGTMGEVKTLLMKPDGWKFKPKPPPEPTTTPASTTGSTSASGPAPRAF